MIEQGYLNTNPVVRIRRSNDDYILTYKGKGMMVREEYNLPLNEEAFLHLKEKIDGRLIQKRRYLIPLVGFKSTSVFYERHERIAGESHYPLAKMVNLAIDGITSLSVKPLRLISGLGIGVSVLSFVGVLWAVITQICGRTVTGWASTVCVICFMGGVQLVCLGVLGEYIGKIYMEVKARPRYIISERTWT